MFQQISASVEMKTSVNQHKSPVLKNVTATLIKKVEPLTKVVSKNLTSADTKKMAIVSILLQFILHRS